MRQCRKVNIKSSRGWRNESARHGLAARGIKSYRKQEIRETTLGKRQVFSNDPEVRKIQEEINRLLYTANEYKGEETEDHEVMTITCKRDKKQHFAFLKDNTRWQSVGSWTEKKSFHDEPNVTIQIEFLDTKNEKVGRRLRTLFRRYNRRAVKENVLYVRTEPVEESTLELKKWRQKTD